MKILSAKSLAKIQKRNTLIKGLKQYLKVGDIVECVIVPGKTWYLLKLGEKYKVVNTIHWADKNLIQVEDGTYARIWATKNLFAKPDEFSIDESEFESLLI